MLESTIAVDDVIYAQLIRHKDYVNVHNKTEWFGNQSNPLQGSLMCYGAHKVFKAHRHILNPRIINKTQECFVVIKGLLSVTILIRDKKQANSFINLGTLVAEAGDAIFVWGGFHEVKILEDGTMAYEIKAGQFNGVISDDKEFLTE